MNTRTIDWFPGAARDSIEKHAAFYRGKYTGLLYTCIWPGVPSAVTTHSGTGLIRKSCAPPLFLFSMCAYGKEASHRSLAFLACAHKTQRRR